jgi:hypothetical protein
MDKYDALAYGITVGSGSLPRAAQISSVMTTSLMRVNTLLRLNSASFLLLVEITLQWLVCESESKQKGFDSTVPSLHNTHIFKFSIKNTTQHEASSGIRDPSSRTKAHALVLARQFRFPYTPISEK